MSSEFGGFGLIDRAPLSVVTMVNEDTNFPKEWCKNGIPNEPTQASTTNCKIRFEFVGNSPLEMVALIGHNMDDGDTINFNTYTSSDWATGKVTINLEPRWYSRYLYKNSPEGVVSVFRSNIYKVVSVNQQYYEIELSSSHNPLVGEICLFESSYQFNRNYKWGYQRIFNASKVMSRVNNTFYAKQANEGESYRLSFENVPPADYSDIQESFRARGYNNLFIPDYDELECYYGLLTGNSLPLKHDHSGYAFNMNFEESSA